MSRKIFVLLTSSSIVNLWKCKSEGKLSMIRVIILGLGVAIGGFAVVFGEADDSPGLQGLGVIFSLFCMYKIYQKFQRKSRR